MKGNAMATLSITKAWNETVEFVRREAGLLFPIAFMLIALPGGILQLFAPGPGASQAEQVRAVLMLIPFGVVAGVIGLIGTIALSFLALRPGNSVGEALQVGARRFIMLFAAWLLISLAAAVALIPLVLLLGIFGENGEPATVAGTVVLLLLLYLVVFIALWVRLMLMPPVAAVESVGPIEIIRRSWNLTAGHFWKLLGFVLLLVLAAIVVLLAATVIAGILIFLIAGPPAPGSASMIVLMLVTAVLQSVFTILFTTVSARIYVQLSGEETPRVFT
jgi:hypothetical protein